MFLKLIHEPRSAQARIEDPQEFTIFSNVKRVEFAIVDQGDGSKIEWANIWCYGDPENGFLLYNLGGDESNGNRPTRAAYVLNDEGQTIERYFPRAKAPIPKVHQGGAKGDDTLGGIPTAITLSIDGLELTGNAQLFGHDTAPGEAITLNASAAPDGTVTGNAQLYGRDAKVVGKDSSVNPGDQIPWDPKLAVGGKPDAGPGTDPIT